MSNEFFVQSYRGSLWHRWDPHIYPMHALYDQYTGLDTRHAFLSAIETSS